jgi:hypothetical protein
MALQGKGFFTWQIPRCEGGNVNALTTQAKTANLSHVLVKIANGILTYNVDQATGVDHAMKLTQALHSQGIQVWGWHYVYGNNPQGEANIAIQRIQQLGVDGYVIDAEAEYKEPGKAAAAKAFMSRLRAALPNLPIALSSYRYPSYHPQLPWKEFLDGCTYNMPQVYWMQAHNAGEQLRRTVLEFQSLTPYRPIIPTGAAFIEHGWQPKVGEVLDFLQTAQSLNLSAANFWEWSDARGPNLPGIWEAIRDYSWGQAAAPQDFSQTFIDALNTHDPAQVVKLYTSTAVHVNAARTIQGLEAIQTWYTSLLTQILPSATFTLTGFSGSGASRHLTWTAISSQGNVLNGNDTLGLMNNQIAYHYTFFTVTK